MTIEPNSSLPPDSPLFPLEPSPDEYSTQPFEASYPKRLEQFLAFIRRNPAPNNAKAAWYELARLQAGDAPRGEVLSAALDAIETRQECADCTLHGILRLVYQFRYHPHQDTGLLERAYKALQEFKYWPDEMERDMPGEDTLCTWTENHYILFASAGYLAGQLFVDTEFSSSKLSGQELMARNRPRLLQWMNLRFFTGFSEWLSHTYDEDLTALLNLVDFCKDDEIRQRATIIIDLILFDMAVNNFSGVFGSTHGCCYENSKKWAAQESTSDTLKLLFGRGIFTATDNMSAIAFALSTRYQAPNVLYEIANDQQRPELLNRQRMGINVAQAKWWGLGFRDIEDGMHLLTMEAYLHPRMANLFIKMMDTFNWWDHPFFSAIQPRRGMFKLLKTVGLLPLAARRYKKDLCRSAREEANLYTYRTPDYMLSAAQDYRQGYGGDQQHIWQATLGPNAVCFTTHPAHASGPTPNYWVGSGVLPRVAQVKNVLIAVHNLQGFPMLTQSKEIPYTHAWLSHDHFEEIIEQEGWIFARLGEGYLALLSEHPYEWRELPGEDRGREIIVRQRENIWLCELGRRTNLGQPPLEFEAFMQRILQAEVLYSNAGVSYHSPTQGHLQFGWKGPLRQDGRVIPLKDYPRYGNPYAQAAFPLEAITIALGDDELSLDWMNAGRQATGFIG